MTGSGSLKREGVIGGGQIGYNFMLSPNWLLGIEADISAADINSSSAGCSATGCATTDFHLNYFGTVRGRLGHAVNGLLLYGTGGLLWADTSSNRTITSVAAPIAAPLVGQSPGSSSNSTGWTAGGGIEWMFAPQWSAKVEYLYGEFDTSADYRYNFVSTTADRHYDTRHELNSLKFGVNYHFGG